MVRWISIAALLLIPICAMAVTISGGTLRGGDLTAVAYTAPIVVTPNQQGKAYKDTFTRANGDLVTQNSAVAGDDAGGWEYVTNTGGVLISSNAVGTSTSLQLRASNTNKADTLSQYVAAQITGTKSSRYHGITLRDRGLSIDPSLRQFYTLRHQSTGGYNLRLCQGDYDCGSSATIYKPSNAQLGTFESGDSLGMEVDYGTGDEIKFSLWHWSGTQYPNGPPARPWGTPNLTVCASGCDVVWTTAPSNYVDTSNPAISLVPADAGYQGGFYTGSAASGHGFDNWMFGDTLADAQVPGGNPEPPPEPPTPPPGDGGGEPVIIVTGNWPDYTPQSFTPVPPDQFVAGVNQPAWGHLHPECAAIYGPFDYNNICPKNVYGSSDPSNPTVVSNCRSSTDFQLGLNDFSQRNGGDNIVIDCVLVDAPGDLVTPPTGSTFIRGAQCESNDGDCRNIVYRRVTFDGSYARNEGQPGYSTSIAGSNGLLFTSSQYNGLSLTTRPDGNPVRHTTLVEKSIFQGHVRAIQQMSYHVASDVDLSSLGYPGYAAVWRDNIFRYADFRRSGASALNDHAEMMAIQNSPVQGVLFLNNVFSCAEGESCNTGIALFQPKAGGVDNVRFQGNRFVGDNNGYDFTFNVSDAYFAAGTEVCATNIRFIDNLFEHSGTNFSETGWDPANPLSYAETEAHLWNMGECGAVITECYGNTLNGTPYVDAARGCVE